jgi:hypothetical protein
MAVGTWYNAKGNNVNPTSSILYVRFEDVDCSDISANPKAPLDGQFLIAPGKTGTSKAAAAVGDIAKLFSSSTVGELSMTKGATLAMVWRSGFKTDGDALGESRVPVVRSALRFKTKLFSVGTAGQKPSDAGYAVGTQLTVGPCTDDIGGDTLRLVLAPATTPATHASWVVGYVTRLIADDAVAPEIEVQLYDKPILQGVSK